MSDGKRRLERLIDVVELEHEAVQWRHALATLAALLGIAPLMARVGDSLAPTLARGGVALWSAVVVGWAVAAAEGLTLRRERRRLIANAASDERRR